MPRSLRPGLGVAYLFCRAADTIADTALLPPSVRLARLETFRRQFDLDGSAGAIDPNVLAQIASEVGGPQEIPEERELLLRLPECFTILDALTPADQECVRTLVTVLTRGMQTDLSFFPGEESGELRALETEEELEQYTYHVAGCVGEFWTEMQAGHRRWAAEPSRRSVMRVDGKRFGQALQMTNIIRDATKDFRLGRCYYPLERLREFEVTPEELAAGEQPERHRALNRHYLEKTVELFRSGQDYIERIPRRELRLRLACAWPLLLGLATLERVALSPEDAPKISRTEVTRIVRRSMARAASNRALRRERDALEARALAAIAQLPQGPASTGT